MWTSIGDILGTPRKGSGPCLVEMETWWEWQWVLKQVLKIRNLRRPSKAEESLCSTSGWDSMISHFSSGSDIYSFVVLKNVKKELEQNDSSQRDPEECNLLKWKVPGGRDWMNSWGVGWRSRKDEEHVCNLTGKTQWQLSILTYKAMFPVILIVINLRHDILCINTL